MLAVGMSKFETLWALKEGARCQPAPPYRRGHAARQATPAVVGELAVLDAQDPVQIVRVIADGEQARHDRSRGRAREVLPLTDARGLGDADRERMQCP